MKNKKGFISMAVVYSFVIVFLLVMLSLLTSYAYRSSLIGTQVKEVKQNLKVFQNYVRHNAIKARVILGLLSQFLFFGFDRFEIPDILGVFFNGPVCGKYSCRGNISKRFLIPGIFIGNVEF